MSAAAIREAIEHRDKLVRLADEAIRELMQQHCASQPDDQEKDVHTEHCCVIHGCKYRDDDCPVETEKLIQSFPCESCQYD